MVRSKLGLVDLDNEETTACLMWVGRPQINQLKDSIQTTSIKKETPNT